MCDRLVPLTLVFHPRQATASKKPWGLPLYFRQFSSRALCLKDALSIAPLSRARWELEDGSWWGSQEGRKGIAPTMSAERIMRQYAFPLFSLLLRRGDPTASISFFSLHSARIPIQRD